MFFVEKAQDESGNRLFTNVTPCVIEADIEEYGPGLFRLHIIGPEVVKSKWATIRLFSDGAGGWVECEGPARVISYAEREQIIVAAGARAWGAAVTGA